MTEKLESESKNTSDEEKPTFLASFVVKIKSHPLIGRILSFYSHNFVLLVCIKLIVIGAILRIVVTRSHFGDIDEEEAIALLQGRDLFHGRFTLFRYGYYQAGNLQSIATGIFTSIFGMSPFTARLVPFLFLVATSVVLFRAFVHTPYKNTMRYVMAALWIFPGAFVITSTKITGTNELVILLIALSLVSAYYAGHSLRNTRYFYLWAFFAGILTWTSLVTIFHSIVCLLWIYRSAPALKKERLKPLGLFLLGAIGLIITTTTTKGGPFVHNFEKGVEISSTSMTSTLDATQQFFGLSPLVAHPQGVNSLGYVAFLILAFTGLFAVYALYKSCIRIEKLKKSDFAYLQLEIFSVYGAMAVLSAVLSVDLSVAFFYIPLLSLLFLFMYAAENRVYFSILASVLLLSSCLTISLNIDNVDKTTSHAMSLETTLKKENISRVYAPHTIAYPLVVESNNIITATPLDKNNFDVHREKKVSKDAQAIVTFADNFAQNNLVYCVQGFYGEAFERIESKNMFIYVIERDKQDDIGNVLRDCQKTQEN